MHTSSLMGPRPSALIPRAPRLSAPRRDNVSPVVVHATDLEQLRAELERLRRENDMLRARLSPAISSANAAAAAANSSLQARAREANAESNPPSEASTSAATTATATASAVATVEAPAVPAGPTLANIWEQPSEIISKMLSEVVKWPEPGTSFWETRPARAVEMPASPSNTDPTPRDTRPLNIVHVTAELAPHAKVGGLGDVVQGLTRAHLQRGHNVEVMLPYYEFLKDELILDKKLEAEFGCPKAKVWDGVYIPDFLTTRVYSGKIAGIPVLLFRPDWNECNLFKGGKIYAGGYNEVEAYLHFCRAALEFLRVTNRQPDIIHLHEWQASAAALLFWDFYSTTTLKNPRLVLTIHNMDSTGEVRQEEFAATGVPGAYFATVDKALDERTIGHNPERLNLLKGGIVYSNVITTVSPTYADETLNGGAAGWLKSTLAKPEVRSKYKGVLNGIDTVEWDPTRDPFLPVPFSAQFPQGKEICKRYLQTGLGMNVDANKPLVACISRLVPQKGIHLIKSAVHKAARSGGQFVLLGTGHADGPFKQMANHDYRESKDVRLMLFYSEPLAHLIYAAADIVIVPSMFEPCGLTQMIAARYGALPLVRKTGGLADTVKDVDEGQGGNGFTFTGVDERSMDHTMERAFRYFWDQKESFKEIRKRNLELDFSWSQSAGQYAEIYKSIMSPIH